jgi:hypothetical protein
VTIDQLLQIENDTTEQLIEQRRDISPVFAGPLFHNYSGAIWSRIESLSNIIDALNEQEGKAECQTVSKSRKK